MIRHNTTITQSSNINTSLSFIIIWVSVNRVADIMDYYKKQGRAAKYPTSFFPFIVLVMSLRVITGTFVMQRYNFYMKLQNDFTKS